MGRWDWLLSLIVGAQESTVQVAPIGFTTQIKSNRPKATGARVNNIITYSQKTKNKGQECTLNRFGSM